MEHLIMMFKRNFSDVVREKANGRWLEILPAVSGKLADAVKNAPYHVPCPRNGGTDGFRFFKEAKATGAAISNSDGAMQSGFDVLMWAEKWSFKTALHEVAHYLGLDDEWKSQANQNSSPAKSAKANFKVSDSELQSRRLKLRQVWQEAHVLTDPQSQLARVYLRNRGLKIEELNLAGISKTIRFHPKLAYVHKKQFVGYFPALVSLVSYNNGECINIHRTYLGLDGKKLQMVIDGKKLPTKKLMARCTNSKPAGSSISLGKTVNGVIDIAEGIETALSVMQAKHVACWPCINTALLGNFEPPTDVHTINVWADKDKEKDGKCAGLDAAIKLFERMEKIGVNVNILMPIDDIPDNSNSIDWNDVLVTKGADTFPKTSHLQWQ
uniref:DUF7146 domain-containing protein n=1 Tax=Photobacterium leiognathi TaxID=553611 RepID=UPI003B968753